MEFEIRRRDVCDDLRPGPLQRKAHTVAKEITRFDHENLDIEERALARTGPLPHGGASVSLGGFRLRVPGALGPKIRNLH